MTLLEIQNALRRAGIALSPRQIQRDIRRLRARPAGIFRTRPQTWPADLPRRIAVARGRLPADGAPPEPMLNLNEILTRARPANAVTRQTPPKGKRK